MFWKKKKQKSAGKEGFSVERNELEQITEALKRECTEAMNCRFQELLRGYSSENPIEDEEAKAILSVLIGEAVAHRGKYVGRVETGIERGGLFDRYYDELGELNAMTIQANAALQRMEAAKRDYLQKRANHRQAQERVYVDLPDVAAEAERDRTPEPDLWKRVFPDGEEAADFG